MPIKVVGFMHHGIRIGTADDDVEKARSFYGDLLGMEVDSQRPEIPGIPGLWVNIDPGQRTKQIHVMSAEGQSPAARSDREDPTLPHIALAVEDLDEARRELDARGVWYWEIGGLVGPSSAQVFVRDPSGNYVELQQAPPEILAQSRAADND
ncbi:MAG: glyoxalase [Alphaproteobacteria bacterium]|nr:glyoxalase [Alphaproteobacteria bacterium]